MNENAEQMTVVPLRPEVEQPDEALMERHRRAMKLVKECTPDERMLLLAMVCWPEAFIERGLVAELEDEAA